MDKQIDKTMELIIKVCQAVAEVIGLFLLIYGICAGGMEGRISWFLFLIMTVAIVILIGFECRNRKKIEDREAFLDYLHFLFTCRGGNGEGFRVLPRMCLDFERKGRVNPIHINSLKLSFESDLSAYDNKELHPQQKISYKETMFFQMDVQNNKLPKQYFCYLMNEYSGEPIRFVERHGSSREQFEKVNVTSARNKIDRHIGIYSWDLNKSKITQDKSIPIDYLVEFNETDTVETTSVIHIYPKKYGQVIDQIEVSINCKSKKRIIKDVRAYHIGKDDGGVFGIHDGNSTTVDPERNEAKVIIYNPRCGWTDVYYVEVDWILTKTTIG